MKKIYLLALSFIVAVVTVIPFKANTIAATNVSNRDGTTKEVVVRDLHYPTIPRPRSATPFISSFYSADISLLEIYFNYYVGTVTVNILNGTLQCIAQYICDTEVEAEVFMNLSLSPNDTYTIHIVGKNYEGIGYFIP